MSAGRGRGRRRVGPMSGGTAIVTGAAGGLGGRIGERLAAAGHELLLVDLDPAVEEVAAAAGARAVVADLTKAEGRRGGP